MFGPIAPILLALTSAGNQPPAPAGPAADQALIERAVLVLGTTEVLAKRSWGEVVYAEWNEWAQGSTAGAARSGEVPACPSVAFGELFGEESLG